MRRPVAALVAAVAAGVLVVVAAGVTRERTEAFTLGVGAAGPAATLAPGDEACQAPIDVAAGFDALTLIVETGARRGADLRISVRESGSGAVLRSARLAGGYRGKVTRRIRTGRVDSGATVAVCVRNAGRSRILLYGGPPDSSRSTHLLVNGRPQAADAAFGFQRDDAASLLSLVPDMLERASLFRGPWESPVPYWVLLVVVTAGLPVLLIRALRAAGGG